jgi:hypothetical protein
MTMVKDEGFKEFEGSGLVTAFSKSRMHRERSAGI